MLRTECKLLCHQLKFGWHHWKFVEWQQQTLMAVSQSQDWKLSGKQKTLPSCAVHQAAKGTIAIKAIEDLLEVKLKTRKSCKFSFKVVQRNPSNLLDERNLLNTLDWDSLHPMSERKLTNKTLQHEADASSVKRHWVLATCKKANESPTWIQSW